MLDVAFATTSNASLVVKFLAVSFFKQLFHEKSMAIRLSGHLLETFSSKPAKRKKANRGKARPIWYNKKYQEWEDDEDDEEEDDPYIPAVKKWRHDWREWHDWHGGGSGDWSHASRGHWAWVST
jgi:hypothetical protein